MKRVFLAAMLIAATTAQAQHIITTIAGNTITQYIGDGSPATAYSLAQPKGICMGPGNSVLAADYADMRIRKVSNDTLYTIAGGDTSGYCGDGGPASAAGFRNPDGICMDRSGNIFITEWYNSTVRRIDGATGNITTVAGCGIAGFSGDGGPATAAKLGNPGAAATDPAGNIIIPDNYNHRIRFVNRATGEISTIAGTGANGYAGDSGPATMAKLSFPNAATTDGSGNIYFTEAGNHTIRRIDHTTGIITTVAGTGATGYTGDGGPATAARLNGPTGLFYGYGNNLVIADHGNNVVRVVDWAGNITTIAGNGGYGFAGDGGPATAATFRQPYAVCADAIGNVFIADEGNSTIRKVAAPLTLGLAAGPQEAHIPQVFPNPCSGQFSVVLPLQAPGTVMTVADLTGRVVMRRELNATTTTCELDVPDGLYLLHILNTDGTPTTVKLAVARGW